MSWIWRQLGNRDSLPDPVEALTEATLGVSEVVTGPAAIEALLADATTTVPYADRSAELGLGAFPLALDGVDHDHARDLIGEILTTSAAAHDEGVERARERAQEIVAVAGTRLDVVADLIDPVLQTWCETWFGLPGEGLHLQRVGQLTTHAMFLNPVVPASVFPKLKEDTAAVARCQSLIAEGRARWTPMVAKAPAGTAVRLLADHPKVAGNEAVTAHLTGLTVGPLALGSKSLAGAVDALLGEPGRIGKLGTLSAARAAFDQVMAVRPPLPAVPRQRGADGAYVLALTQAAAAVTPDDPARWAYGHGPHRCMGRPQIAELAEVVLLALARGRPTRRAGPRGKLRPALGPTGVRSWPFPGHLVVDLRP